MSILSISSITKWPSYWNVESVENMPVSWVSLVSDSGFKTHIPAHILLSNSRVVRECSLDSDDICINLPDIDHETISLFIQLLTSGTTASSDEKELIKLVGLLNQFLVTGVFTFIEPENSEDLVNDETPKQSFYEKFIQFHEKFDSDVRQFVGGSGTQEKTQHCEFCDQSFTRARHLIDHIISSHPDKQQTLVSCSGCGRSFSNNAWLSQHAKYCKERDKIKFSCSYCSYVTSIYEEYKVHSRTFHSLEEEEIKKFKCSDCNKKFLCVQNLRSHEKFCNSRNGFKCRYCSLEFTGYKNYAEHVKMKHQDKVFSCQKCGRGFMHKNNVKSHERFCTAFDNSKLLANLSESANCEKLVCKVNPFSLNGEEQVVSQDKRAELSVHDLSRKVKNLIDSYASRDANKNKIYVCGHEGCSYNNYNYSNFRSHIESKHVEEDYSCQLCNRKMKTWQSYQRHQKSEHSSA